jgi:hypothetical protein
MATGTQRKPAIRIGYGWDSHEFKSGIPLKIGNGAALGTTGRYKCGQRYEAYYQNL